MIPAELSVDLFLKEYWQKKPLLIRNALPDFIDPLSPEELAGLACENEVESRLVFTKDDSWSLKDGPFQENDFTSLPEHDWTLLVQAVDHWFPEVKKLGHSLDFIPAWRIDDVMVSYAEKNAGVGPHFDYYDVFIIQGKGKRLWKIGQQCDSQSELITDSGLKLLKDFEQSEEWELNSGDVLYIPPGLAHYGVSLDSSLSYSIGFRAPSASEAIISFSDEICASLTEDQRFTDSNLAPAKFPGEIDSAAINTIEDLIFSSLKNKNALANWFGKYMTEVKNEESIAVPEYELSEKEFLQILISGEPLIKHPASRFAYIAPEKTLTIFSDGVAFTFSSPSKLIESLNSLLNSSESDDILDLAKYLNDPDCLNLLCQLYNQGTLTKE